MRARLEQIWVWLSLALFAMFWAFTACGWVRGLIVV